MHGGDQHVDSNMRECHADEPTTERQQHAFREQLAKESASRGAQRDPRGDFRPARFVPRVLQRRDVDARDEKQKNNSAREYHQHRSRIADHFVPQGTDHTLHRAVCLRVLTG